MNLLLGFSTFDLLNKDDTQWPYTLEPTGVLPEDSFTLKTVILDNKLQNLEFLHRGPHMDIQEHHRG